MDMPNTQPQDSEWLDEVLLAFAKRVESMPRGKTYDWDSEKQAIDTHTKKQILLGKIEQAKFIRANVESLLDVKWLDERIAELEQQLKTLDTSLGEENV